MGAHSAAQLLAEQLKKAEDRCEQLERVAKEMADLLEDVEDRLAGTEFRSLAKQSSEALARYEEVKGNEPKKGKGEPNDETND